MKNRIILIFTFVFMLSAPLQIHAFECNVDYDAAKSEIVLNGKAQAPFSVVVTPYEAEVLESVENEEAVIATQFDYRLEDAFEKTLPIDPDLPSGKFMVTVSSNEKFYRATEADSRLYGELCDNMVTVSEVIYHISTDDAEELLTDINASDNTAALYETVSMGKTEEFQVHYTELLSIEPSEFETYGEYACRQMIGTKDGADYESVQEFKNLMKEYEILYKSLSEGIDVIENNKGVFDCDVERFVSSLGAESKSKLHVLIKNFEADGKSFSDALPSLSALAAVQASDRWQIIKAVVTDSYDDILNIEYQNVSNLDKVFQKMATYTYASFDDISKNFKKAEKAVNKKNDKETSSGGGGGGGGGGGISSPDDGFEIAPSRQEQRGETKFSFSDVKEDFWAYDAISTLAEKKVISGYPNGTFLPGDSVTRAEFVKMLVTAFDIKSSSTSYFEDVGIHDWHYSYINSAYAAGLVSGVGDRQFNPNGKITREDACVIVYRYMNNLGVLESGSADFADENEFSDYAGDAIRTLAANGIINGVGDGLFDAKTSINRASCAVLILNCINAG